MDMVEAGPKGPLSKDDEKRLAEIIDEIEYVVFESWRVAGPLFQELRDKRLYRETHSNMEDYCRDTWGIGKRRVNQIIYSAKNAKLIESKMGTAVPKTVFKSEKAARPLSKVEHGKMDEVAELIKQTAEREEITEKVVKEIVETVCPPKGKKDKKSNRIKCEHCGGRGWILRET